MNTRVGSHDTADELDHTVSNTAESPDDENLEHSVSLGRGSRCRVTTYSIRIPGTVFDLVVFGAGLYLSTWERREFHGSTMVG